MRLPGFDYARPYFYMVTLKRNAGYPALSRISDDPAAHWLEPNEITFLKYLILSNTPARSAFIMV